MPLSSLVAKKLSKIERRVRSIEAEMLRRKDLEPLFESLQLLRENPNLLKEIEKVFADFREGKYFTYDQVFGGNL